MEQSQPYPATPGGDRSSPTRRRATFFPPPFRLDCVSPSPTAEPGPAHATHDQPRKRPRLQFSSEIRQPIQQYNPDGTESFEWTRYQATLRLKSKWESIFERFKDAHLEDQDEIYLGRRSHGEKIKVVRDRGTLRRVQDPLEFGCFHIRDQDLNDLVPRQQDDDDDDEGFEVIGWSEQPANASGPSNLYSQNPYYSKQTYARVKLEDDDNQMHVPEPDPELDEFLQAEARRRALCGPDQHLSDDEPRDDVIDFTNPNWDAEPGEPLERKKRKYRRRNVPIPVYEESEEEIIDDEQLDEERERKWNNIERLLAGSKPFETLLPYDDIPGLEDLLANPPSSQELPLPPVKGKQRQSSLPPTPPRTRSSASVSASDEESAVNAGNPSEQSVDDQAKTQADMTYGSSYESQDEGEEEEDDEDDEDESDDDEASSSAATDDSESYGSGPYSMASDLEYDHPDQGDDLFDMSHVPVAEMRWTLAPSEPTSSSPIRANATSPRRSVSPIVPGARLSRGSPSRSPEAPPLLSVIEAAAPATTSIPAEAQSAAPLAEPVPAPVPAPALEPPSSPLPSSSISSDAPVPVPAWTAAETENPLTPKRTQPRSPSSSPLQALAGPSRFFSSTRPREASSSSAKKAARPKSSLAKSRSITSFFTSASSTTASTADPLLSGCGGAEACTKSFCMQCGGAYSSAPAPARKRSKRED